MSNKPVWYKQGHGSGWATHRPHGDGAICCPFCGTPLTSDDWVHVGRHRGSDEAEADCPQCGLVTISLSELST